MLSLHGDFILQQSMPAPALESAQAALQGVQILMTRQGGRDEEETCGWRGCEGYTLAAGGSARNEGLKCSTHSNLNRVDCTAIP
jgi:hypothetical protein